MPVLSLPASLPYLGNGLRLEAVCLEETGVTVVVTAVRPRAPCPRCHRPSRRVHSRYPRTIADLPCSGAGVTVRLQSRRFRCRHVDCPRRIFCERWPGLVACYARRTDRLRTLLQAVGFALGGRPGARLLPDLHLHTSRMTLLRLVRAAPLRVAPPPRVVGVDDWALRRGQTYGTVLVDLERHRPVDLLPDATAAAFAAWLQAHGGVEVVSRDRGGAYAEGARHGAPAAVQVADRWHLLHNLRQAVERLLARQHSAIAAAARALAVEAVASHPEPPAGEATALVTAADRMAAGVARARARRAPSSQTHDLPAARRARRLARYEAVVAMRAHGASLRTIAKTLGIDRQTVQGWLQAGAFPERQPPPPRPTLLAPFEPYLRARWDSGCHNALVLWRELQAQGFAGGKSIVRAHLARWRPTRVAGASADPQQEGAVAVAPSGTPVRTWSVRDVTWLLLRAPDDLDDDEQAYLTELCRRCPDIGVAQGLAHDFFRIVRQRDEAALGPWVQVATASGLADLRRFAAGLLRDWAAVRAALLVPWSNGQTEGQVTRIKAVKRQMYGRARFDLLRRRFLGPG